MIERWRGCWNALRLGGALILFPRETSVSLRDPAFRVRRCWRFFHDAHVRIIAKQGKSILTVADNVFYFIGLL